MTQSSGPIGNLESKIGQEVAIPGWVDTVRDLKWVQFVVLRDRTGQIQVTNEKSEDEKRAERVSELAPESTIVAYGTLQENPKVKLRGMEILLEDFEVTSEPKEPLPIEPGAAIDLRLDYRHVDLRFPENRLIFQIQTTAEQAMREYWLENGFIEIHSPKLMSGASESGAELFQMDYFGDTASLAQSPQFYKQMAMSAGLERVFEIGPVFRANKSHTRRHDTEFTSVDVELSWIDSHEDVMEFEEGWLQHVLARVYEAHGDDIQNYFGAELTVPTTPFPRVTLEEANGILRKMGHFDQDGQVVDLDPTGERKLSEYIQEHFGHEMVFVTDYPADIRPFYHMRREEAPDITKSFDLMWKGVEITTGAQREHRYDVLAAQAEEKRVDPSGIKDYLGFFKHGCPPHGGYGFGLSRMLMQMVEAQSVKDVTFMWRGPNRLAP